MPSKAANRLLELARQVQGGPDRRDRLETFKEYFSSAMGESCSRSSSASWADADLDTIEARARKAAPGYIAAFYDALEALRLAGSSVPSTMIINEVLREEGVPFRIDGETLLDASGGVPVPSVPEPPDQMVREALNDAKALHGNGAGRAVDRMHTAIHAYFLHLARTAEIPIESDPTTGRLFRVLREQHPALQPVGPRAEDITKMLKALAGAVEALSPLRNHASAAHPNPVLDHPEAEAFANCVRTLFSYAIACVERLSRGSGRRGE
jgi:hypothetical protein